MTPESERQPDPGQQYAPDVHLHWWEKVIGFFVLLFGGGKP